MIATKKRPGIRHKVEDTIRIPIRKEARCQASVTVAERPAEAIKGRPRWWAIYEYSANAGGYGGYQTDIDHADVKAATRDGAIFKALTLLAAELDRKGKLPGKGHPRLPKEATKRAHGRRRRAGLS